ncbi:uncharacterized protein TNCV_2475091 [Trichonephila clavipes]|nr:uncharacterized protein TNCV_2475091 [Trichonephila clavipes]
MQKSLEEMQRSQEGTKRGQQKMQKDLKNKQKSQEETKEKMTNVQKCLDLKNSLEKKIDSVKEKINVENRIAGKMEEIAIFEEKIERVKEKYFVDGLRDGEIQRVIRMADAQDLKSALLYVLKLKPATQASRKDRHFIRGARTNADAPYESPWINDIDKLREEIQAL